MSWQIAEATAAADLAACMALRFDVFCREQGVGAAQERDGQDAAAVHLLARLDGAPVGALRLRRLGETAKIERVCVARAHRGTGLGAALVRAGLDRAARVPGATRVQLGAQLHALAFYERFGFSACGAEYIDAGMPQRDMARPLPLTCAT